MSIIEIKNKEASINLYYEDWGSGTPVIFIHGWPLSHEMWEYQMNTLAEQGLRCIAYDRRGFGKSDKPWDGYDFDTLAHDLNGFLEALDINGAVLVGFSMGGGEVVRYLSHFGSKRVSKAVLISSVAPVLIQKRNNPEGVPAEKFDEMIIQLKKDRPAFLAAFGKQFYGEKWILKAVSNETLEWTSQLALKGSPKATIECIRSFSETDFRSDLEKIEIPILVIHGDADKIVPFDTTGKIAARLIKNGKLSVFEGAPHGLFFTDSDRLNSELISFINEQM